MGKTQLRFRWPDAKAWLKEHGIEEEEEATDE